MTETIESSQCLTLKFEAIFSEDSDGDGGCKMLGHVSKSSITKHSAACFWCIYPRFCGAKARFFALLLPDLSIYVNYGDVGVSAKQYNSVAR